MMRDTHQRVRLGAAVFSAACAWISAAAAEEAPAGSTEPKSLSPAPENTDAAPPSDVGAPTTSVAASNDAVLHAIEENKKALAEAQAKIAELSARMEATAVETEPEKEDTRLRIYGFMDVGVQRMWVPSGQPIGAILNAANATSFVVGNLNLYVDAQPVPGWRGLLEVRFTNAPQGEVANFGGVAGTFKRTTTLQYDPHASTPNAPMWGGYTVIERAHIDWTDHDLFKLRVGNFFTPFGIWNVDHGTPTLIPLLLPQLIAFGQFPIRQTGIMVYGSKMSGGWELGYNATVTNGRQELSNFAFDDNRGFGGRLFANREDGDLTIKFGLSGYTARVRDKEVDVVGVSPGIQLTSHSTFDYREVVGGADVAIDAGPTRIRAEGAVRQVQYETGKHEVNLSLGAPGSFQPNRIATSGYVLVAHQLPFWGLEPFALLDSIFSPFGIGDTVIAPGVGFNIRFNSSVQLKTQFGYAFLLNLRDSSKERATLAPSNSDTALVASRLVLVY
jgi:hypothetical protein